LPARAPPPRATYTPSLVPRSHRSGDESCCFGAITLPLATRDYEATGFFYRAFNGGLYGAGKVVSGTRTAVHRGDQVKVAWDGRAGTLRYFVNGVLQNGGPCFSGITSRVFPAVAFYGPRSRVSITGFTDTSAAGAESGEGEGGEPAEMPRFDVYDSS
jgi:hypothetical protein